MGPLLHPPDSTPGTGLGPTNGISLQIQGGVWGLTMPSQGRQATRPVPINPGDTRPWDLLGVPETQSGSGHPREKRGHFSWQACLPQGLALLPGFPALAVNQCRGEAGGPAFGPPLPLSSPPPGTRNPWAVGLFRLGGAAAPGLLVPLLPSSGALGLGPV